MKRNIFRVGDGTSRTIYFPTEKEIEMETFYKESGIPRYLYSVEELDYQSMKNGMSAFLMFGSILKNKPEHWNFLNSFPGQDIFERYEYYENIFCPLLIDEINLLWSKLIREQGSFYGLKSIENKFSIKRDMLNISEIYLISSAIKLRDILLFAKDDRYISRLM